MKRIRILRTPAALAALGLFTFAFAPAFASLGKSDRAGTSASVASGPVLGDAAKRIKRQEHAQEAYRETSYRLWFYRKYGYFPSTAQFRDWHHRSYGVYPS